MTQKRASQSVTRPTRTALQGGAGYAVAELVDSFHDLSEVQIALLAVVLTIFFSWVQTTVENAIGKGFLRDVPPTTDPVPGG